MKSYRFLMAVIFLFVGAEVFAATYAFRDKELYNIYGGNTPARVTVFTYPPQPYQPVYSWRTHEYAVYYGYNAFFFVEGNRGYNGDYIGTTDQNGTLDIYVEATPDDESYCGRYTNERFAVGQNYQPETTPISFKIYRKIILDFGPYPPIADKCRPESM